MIIWLAAKIKMGNMLPSERRQRSSLLPFLPPSSPPYPFLLLNSEMPSQEIFTLGLPAPNYWGILEAQIHESGFLFPGRLISHFYQ